jgi:hypothetical protein
MKLKLMTRISILIVFLIAAIACYANGIPRGGIAFTLLGVIFEGLFWIGLLGRKKSSKDSH